MKKIIINGKFYAQKITGVQRFARELILELDNIVSNQDIKILVPKDAVDLPVLKNIQIKKSPFKKSIFWEQLWLPLYIAKQKAIGVHLCHVAPLLKPDIVCIHDANVISNPQWFTKKIYLWYRLIESICAKKAKKILTVSEFSKNELKKHLGIIESNIFTLCEGWQHFNRIHSNTETLSRYKLNKKNFYFSLGTKAQYKNMKWVYDYARKNPNEIFAISGSSYGKIFGEDTSIIPNNVHFLGYLSDEEIKTMMQNCKAFLFPSLYEGFGIPPLEALSTGSPVIVSDIPVMHEIFGDTVHYINPNNTDVDLNLLAEKSVAPAATALDKYSWQKGALLLQDIIKELT